MVKLGLFSSSTNKGEKLGDFLFMFSSDRTLVFLENNLFLLFEEISNPLDIHGLWNELKVFGFTSISGKATSPASFSIWKKQSKEDLGSFLLHFPKEQF